MNLPHRFTLPACASQCWARRTSRSTVGTQTWEHQSALWWIKQQWIIINQIKTSAAWQTLTTRWNYSKTERFWTCQRVSLSAGRWAAIPMMKMKPDTTARLFCVSLRLSVTLTHSITTLWVAWFSKILFPLLSPYLCLFRSAPSLPTFLSNPPLSWPSPLLFCKLHFPSMMCAWPPLFYQTSVV